MKTARFQKAWSIFGASLAPLFIVGLTAWQDTSDLSAFLKGPYLQNVKPDAITIMWESKEPVIGKVVFGKTTSFGEEAAEKTAATIHEVTLNGLQAGTVYHYQAISGSAQSPVYTFTTAVKKDAPFSFAVYGDNKNGPFNHAKIANLILRKHPNFVIHNGDLVDNGNVYKQWEKLFFTPTQRMMNHITLFPALGNHERHAKLYYDFFSLPHNERWYSFDFGNAHFVILDSDIKEKEKAVWDEQLRWLGEDLEKNKAAWTFVNFHHTLFTAGGNYYDDGRIFRKNLLHPIFEKHGVDMVLVGHDHDYERTYPIVSKNGRKPVTYIVCGNGGTPMRYVGRRVFGFVLLHVDGRKLHMQSINIDDRVIDEFTLDKDDPQSMAAYQANRIFFEDIRDPLDAIKYYDEADDSLETGNHAAALAAFEKAYRADTTCVEALAGLAECQLQLEQIDKAIASASLAARKMPQYPESYEVLIDAYVALKKYDRALESCRQWSRIEPDKAGPNREMAKIHARQKRFDLAIKEMQNALAIEPSHAGLYFELGKLYESAGDRNNALTSYQKGMDWFMAETESQALREAREELEMAGN